MSRRNYLCASVALTAMAAPAHAQDNAPASRGESAVQIQEIIVTARKRSENIQKVPISITALAGGDLVNQGAQSVGDVARTAPNVFVTATAANPTAPSYTIRGQVQNDFTVALDPSVGVYVDGVYWARAYGSNAALLDISRVEILKGPQGTLFGRNTTGGAFSIITNDPDPEALSGSVAVAAGNQDQFDVTGILNLPIVNDRVAARFALSRQKNGGWIRETVSGRTIGGGEQWIGRGKLLLRPTETFTLVLSGEYFHYDGSGPVTKNVSTTPFGAGDLQALLQTGGCIQAFNPACPAPIVPGSDSAVNYAGGDPFTVSVDQFPKTLTKTQTYSATGDLDTGWGNLKTIVAYRKVDAFSRFDLDGTPFVIANYLSNEGDGEQFSFEGQLNGTAIDSRLDWTVGAYFFREKGMEALNTTAVPLLNPNTGRLGGSFVRNISYALYGQGTFRLTDALSFTGGLRYSIDDRRKRQFSELTTQFVTCPVGLDFDATGTSCSAAFSRSDSALSYTAALDFRVAPDILVYAKTSRGFRAGGFNARGGADLPGGGTFGPETVTDYEGGLKSELFDRRVRFNLAGFYSRYKDIQSTLLAQNPNTGQLQTFVQNAAKGRIYGFEAELQAILFEGFRLSGSVGHTNAKYLEFSDANGDRSDETFPLVPKWTWSAAADYTRDLGFASAILHADYSYKSRVVFMRNLDPPFTEAAGFGIVNARAGLDFVEQGFEIAAYARNLFNKTYVTFAIDLKSAGLGYTGQQFGQPRQYGLQGTFRF